MNAPQNTLQGRPIQEQLKQLESLQEIDLQVMGLQKKKSEIPGPVKALDDQIAKANQTIKSKQKEIDEMDKSRKQTIAAVDLNNERLTRATTKLEGVQNQQEYQAANKEIDQLKKNLTTLEEQKTKLVTHYETLQADIAKIQADIAAKQTERTEKFAILTSEISKIDADVARFTKEREQFRVGIDPRVLSQYDRIRVARHGMALAPCIGGRCNGCNMALPPQQYNEMQSNKTFHFCPNCHRIMFTPVSKG